MTHIYCTKEKFILKTLKFNLSRIIDLQYCEYYPEYDKCKQWLERNLPTEFERIKLGNYRELKNLRILGQLCASN